MPEIPTELDELAGTLIKARSALGITQNELHKRTGISREAIKGYESGRNKPGAREIKLLCESLNVTPNVLLFGSETPFEPTNTLYDLMQTSGQLDLVKFVTLLNLLTGKEKSSISFLMESILLGRHSRDELSRRLLGADFISGMMTSLIKSAEEHKKSGSQIDPQAMANELDEMMMKRTENQKKPG
jgi:transcriptional regulator with XRE-family HTH domain